MQRYSRTHLSDPALLESAAANAGHERTATADLLADLAEIDARKLYLPAGYPSMFAFCLGELHLSDDAAYKRIAVARTARRFPGIFQAVARGRLHLTAITLLSPYLTEDTAASLLEAAADKSKAEIERLLAERFPKSDLLTWVAEMPASGSAAQLAPERVGDPQVVVESGPDIPQLAPERVVDRPRVRPLSARSFALQVTLDQGAHDKLRHLQALLSHQIPSGEIGRVIERAFDLAIAELEKRKLARTAKPRRRAGRPSVSPPTFPPTCGARCGSGTAANARLSARAAAGAMPVIWCNSITSSQSPSAANRRWRTCACAATRTISSPPSARSGASSCGTSASRGWRRGRRRGVTGRRLLRPRQGGRCRRERGVGSRLAAPSSG